MPADTLPRTAPAGTAPADLGTPQAAWADPPDAVRPGATGPGAARSGGVWSGAVRAAGKLALAAARTRYRYLNTAGRIRTRWLGSLLLRVVTATLLISAVVVTVLGIFLIQQVAGGLQEAKFDAALNQAREGRQIALGDKDLEPRPGSNAYLVLEGIVSELLPQPSSSGDFSVAIMILPQYRGSPAYLAGFSSGLPTQDIPARLSAAANRHPDRVVYLTVRMPVPGSRRPVQGLLFAARLYSYYQLYYFFPLTQEQHTLSLVQDTLLLSAFALVFLLAGVASLVTRWVVAPVARAAQGARRLSTGNLDDRMPVKGTDELAALARSFNDMAASLQEKMAELEGLSRVQRQFVSDVSHELRTPLTTIRWAVDLLHDSRHQLDADACRSAEILHGQLGRFESLLIDLLEISRFDANAATLDAEPADIFDLIRQAADVAQQLAERKGAKIEFRLPAGACVAEVDRHRVERILRNLLVNAVEHGEGRDVVVTGAGDRDAVAVSVRDYGVGLRPGEEQLVFDRFWRADTARARTTGGTGLGLAIAKEDARLHGGWLEAWGEPGRGSVFRLTLSRQAGAELTGSPLPLGPDEAEELARPRPGRTRSAAAGSRVWRDGGRHD